MKTLTGAAITPVICSVFILGAFWAPSVTLAGGRSNPAVIMMMVDDLPPSAVEDAVRAGELPNIEEHFYKHGTQAENFFTSLAISTASWSTILTGRDVDETCIKGNDVFHSDTFRFDNYLDWRRDFLDYLPQDGPRSLLAYLAEGVFRIPINPARHQHGAAYTALHSCQNLLLPDYLNNTERVDSSGLAVDLPDDQSTVFTTFFMLNNHWLPPGVDVRLACDVIGCHRVRQYGWREALTDWFFIPPGDSNFNHTVTRLGVEKIRRADESVRKNKPIVKKKFLGLYYSIVDSYFHHGYRQGLEALKAIDNAVGEIFRAIKSSEVYGDSIVVLVSDHGFIGGYEPGDENPHYPFRGQEIKLTGVNLSTVLGGYALRTKEKYRMNVEAAYAMEDKYSLKYWEELQLQKFQCTNPSRYQRQVQQTVESGNPVAGTCMNWSQPDSGRRELISAAVTSSSTIALPYASTDSGNWQTPNTWFTLTHYKVVDSIERQTRQVNILEDLLEYERDVNDLEPLTAERVGPKPVDWLAIVIARPDFNRPDSQTQGLRATSDDVILICSQKGQALLFQESESGEPTYRYVPVRDFSQTSSGAVSLKLGEVGDDPLGYRTEGADATWFATAHTAKEWITRFVNAVYPNAVPALARIMSFHGNAEVKKATQGFDIFLNPKYGYFFAPYDDVAGGASQHGMLQRESVKASFFIAGPGIAQNNRVREPMMTIDVVPTVLAALQLVKENRQPHEIGLKYRASLPPAYAHYNENATQLPGDIIRAIFQQDGLRESNTRIEERQVIGDIGP